MSGASDGDSQDTSNIWIGANPVTDIAICIAVDTKEVDICT